MKSSRLLRFSLAVAFCCFPIFAAAAKKPQIPEKYQHWVKEEVPYIITDDEKDEFLHLTSDAERDHFIENFWKVRNPDPNAPVNTYKEEYYRRVAYANEHFGAKNIGDGWRTDRGMVYITLGPPQQKQPYPNSKYLNPLEIWFYQSPSPGLPTHFYVVFYKRSAAEDYRLYSPYIDGPTKLVNTSDAANNPAVAEKIISTDLGSEVARIALSLLPGEPVDVKNPYPSLQSDSILDHIRNYRNLPVNQELLEQRRAALLGVTHRVLLGEQFSELDAVPVRQSGHQVDVDYLFRFHHPQDFTLVHQPDNKYYYSVTLQAKLIGSDGKVIYTDNQHLADYISSADFEGLREKCFGIEGRLPIAPGKYDLDVSVTNDSTKQVFHQTRQVLVPDFDHALAIGYPFFASTTEAPQRDLTGGKPFSFSGIKLSPIGSENAVIAAGAPLRLVYQLWEPPGSPAVLRGKMLDVSYLIGQVSSTTKKEESQAVDRGTFDPSGNMLIGKDLPTDSLIPGPYRLVIRVTDPENHLTAFQSLNFVLSSNPAEIPSLWVVTTPSTPQEQALYWRALSALASAKPSLAVEYLERGLGATNVKPEVYRALAMAYRQLGKESAAEEVERKIPPQS